MDNNLPLPHGGKLIDRRLRGINKEKILKNLNDYYSIQVNRNLTMDIARIGDGSYSPLTGFLDREDYYSVLKNKKLHNDLVWTIPIVLDVAKENSSQIAIGDSILLKNKDIPLAIMKIRDKFTPGKLNDAKMIFGTQDGKHPGVKEFIRKKDVFLGGELNVINHYQSILPDFVIEPRKSRQIFTKKKWKTVVAFHTRNVAHRAHEFLQKCALQITDGLFIHPIIGRTKPGDLLPELILYGYQEFIKIYFPSDRVVLAALSCGMKFAGPREAVFHAIIRKNYGCTHIIIGRDHAGVGGFYRIYEAHEIFDEIGDLGIEILRFKGPYYCKKCLDVVTEKICPHGEKHQVKVSGTNMRKTLDRNEFPPQELMRPEVARFLLKRAKTQNIFSE